MATYTTITDASVDPQAPITSELMSALRDNPIAIAEQATNAPRLNISKRTVLYNSSGSTSTVESTDFEDGYYYRFQFQFLELQTSGTMFIDFMKESNSAWIGTARSTGLPFSTVGNDFFWSGFVTVYNPRETASTFVIDGCCTNTFNSTVFPNATTMFYNRVYVGSSDKIKRVRFFNSGRDIQSGIIWQEKLSLR